MAFGELCILGDAKKVRREAVYIIRPEIAILLRGDQNTCREGAERCKLSASDASLELGPSLCKGGPKLNVNSGDKLSPHTRMEGTI